MRLPYIENVAEPSFHLNMLYLLSCDTVRNFDKCVTFICERHLFELTVFKFQMKTDKMEYRAIIKFLTLEGQTGQQIYDRMKIIYKVECPHYSAIKRWAAEFKRGENPSKITLGLEDH